MRIWLVISISLLLYQWLRWSLVDVRYSSFYNANDMSTRLEAAATRRETNANLFINNFIANHPLKLATPSKSPMRSTSDPANTDDTEEKDTSATNRPLCMVIPTVVRRRPYLMVTLSSLISNMNEVHRNDTRIIIMNGNQPSSQHTDAMRMASVSIPGISVVDAEQYRSEPIPGVTIRSWSHLTWYERETLDYASSLELCLPSRLRARAARLSKRTPVLLHRQQHQVYDQSTRDINDNDEDDNDDGDDDTSDEDDNSVRMIVLLQDDVYASRNAMDRLFNEIMPLTYGSHDWLVKLFRTNYWDGIYIVPPKGVHLLRA
jgi:hypothetical protein